MLCVDANEKRDVFPEINDLDLFAYSYAVRLNVVEAYRVHAYVVYKRRELSFNRSMRPELRKHFDFELQQAKTASAGSDESLVWNRLARAHVLGQFYVGPHLKVHILMLVYALKTINTREVFGQIPRLLLAAPGSLFKKAPLGNTGLSNIGIFQPLPIPDDLQSILNED